MDKSDWNNWFDSFELAIRDRDPLALKQLCHDLNIGLIGQQGLPDELFGFLIRLLSTEAFQKTPGSWRLLAAMEIEYEHTLSDHQKQLLLPILEACFISHIDYAARSTIRDILVKQYAGDDAARSILRLVETSLSDDARLSIVLACRDLVLRYPETSEISKLESLLRQLSNDESHDVRKVALCAVSELTKKKRPSD